MALAVSDATGATHQDIVASTLILEAGGEYAEGAMEAVHEVIEVDGKKYKLKELWYNYIMKKLSDTLKELRVAFTFPIIIKDAKGNYTYYEDSDGLKNGNPKQHSPIGRTHSFW